MKVSLQHADHQRKIKHFTDLASRLRQAGCAQDRSAMWSPVKKVESVTTRWAQESGFIVTRTDDQLIVQL